MRVCDINPFIRYASMSNFSPLSDFVCSYDSRLFYLIDGECRIDIGNMEYTVKKDTLMLWRAGTKYRFKEYSDIRMIVLNFDYTQNCNDRTDTISPITANNFNKSHITELAEFEDCDIFNQALIIKNMQNIKSALIETVEKFNTIELYSAEISSATLKNVLTKVASIYLYSETRSLGKIDTILEYLVQNFDKEITNKDIGNTIGYHPNYINRLMLKHTGITLRQHLINIRLSNARQLLTQTDMPIYEISEKCGFKNIAYFSNIFKLRHKISPNEYRSKHRYLI